MTKKPTTDFRPPPAESDREWFDKRPARELRMRLPTQSDRVDFGLKTTHVIVKRRGKTQLARVPITMPASADPFFVTTLMKDTPKDGVLDLELTGLINAFRGGRRINLEQMFLRASIDYRVPDAKVAC